MVFYNHVDNIRYGDPLTVRIISTGSYQCGMNNEEND